MDHFRHQDGQLFCEGVSVDALCSQVGTPLYVYSKRTLTEHLQRFSAAFAEIEPLVCFSIKSCANVHIIKALAQYGAGADVVSGGELYRARLAGVPPERIVAAGVGKTSRELREILEAKVGWLNVESEQEFEAAAALARDLKHKARLALRVNPDVVDSKTPHKTSTGKKGSKFGVDIDRAPEFFANYGRDPWLSLTGLHAHIGSPIFSPEPYVAAIEKLLGLVETLHSQGFTIDSLDIGGGFAANYDGNAPSWQTYASKLTPLLRPFTASGGKVILEPGRTIAANAGVLLTRIEYLKTGGGRQFAIVDAGMSQQVRPAMYDAYHFIWPTRVSPEQTPHDYSADQILPGLETYDVAGPICESSDFLAQGRKLPKLQRGELLCVYSSGAYGMVMASQYNAVPRPAEVLVDGTHASLIRTRETYEDLVAHELTPTPVKGFE